MARAFSEHRRLPKVVAERQVFAHTTVQAPRLTVHGSGARTAVSLAGTEAPGAGTLQSPEAAPQAGALTGFCSNGWLAERLGSGITAHGPWE